MIFIHCRYFGKVIICVSDFKGDQEARADYTNICLSYPYITDEKDNKRFLLFYRWIHWYMLVLAFLFYLPRKISKSIENPKGKKILEDLTVLHSRYDQGEIEVSQRALRYMSTNLRTHNAIYFRYLGLNVFAILIDLFVLRFTDFLFQDRFISLVPKAYPFHRDPIGFKDYISQTFPPFASCSLGKAHKIIDGRTESIGCHLTNMELYEKVFIIFWFLLFTLILATLFHIIYLALMLIPSARKWFILTSKPLNATQSTRIVVSNVLECLKVGDVYMLSRLKKQMSPSRFYELLLRIGDPKLKSNQMNPNILPPDYKEQGISPGFHTKGNHPYSSPPHNPNFYPPQTKNPNVLNPLLNNPTNPELIKRYPELVKAKNKQNTSILIE